MTTMATTMATDITVGIILVIRQPHFKAIGPLNGPFSSPRGARNAISPPAIYMGPLTYYVLWMDNSDYLSQLLHQISPAKHCTVRLFGTPLENGRESGIMMCRGTSGPSVHREAP